VEIVDKFSYLGDMLSVEGDAGIVWRPKGDCTAVVCEVECCLEVRPGL